MMVKHNKVKKFQRRHLKFVGIERRTEKRYAVAIERFFNFCEFFFEHVPLSGHQLDFYLGEFINHLFQDESPHQWGVDTFAAVRRWLPAWRGHTTLGRMYLRNWSRTFTVRRALPLPVGVLLGMCGVAAIGGDWPLCGALYLGFLGLLRTGELLTLEVHQVTEYFGANSTVISLPESKGAKLKNIGESIVVGDQTGRALLRLLTRGRGPTEKVFNLKFKELGDGIVRTAAAVGVHSSCLTPYALRRGGATFHFSKYGSLDQTTSYGRWALAATAQRYISQAASDLEGVRQPPEGVRRASRFARVFPMLLEMQTGEN